MTIYDRLGPTARHLLQGADQVARDLGQTSIGSAHIVVAAIAEPSSLAAQVLMSRALSTAALRARLAGISPVSKPTTTKGRLDSSAAFALANAMRLAAGLGELVEADLLALSALELKGPVVDTLLSGFGEDASSLAAELRERLGLPEIHGVSATPRDVLENQEVAPETAGPELAAVGARPGQAPPAPPVEPSAESRRADKVTPNLQRFATDLVAQARAGKLDPVVGRDVEMENMVAILLRRSKNNPVLVGPAGVGKTAVVEGLARRIAAGEVPAELASKKVWSIDLGALVGGTTYRGDFEQRLKSLVAELAATGDIAFVDEIHSLVSAGAASGSLGAGNLLKPALARSEITLIGATTPEEYRKFVEADAAWERRFGKVAIDQPDAASTRSILTSLRPLYEAHHQVRITDDALAAAVDLSVRHIPARSLPDKAIDVLDEAGAAAGIRIMRAEGPLGELLEQRAAAIAASYAVNASDAERAAAQEAEELAGAQIAQLLASTDAARDPGRVTAVEVASVIEAWTGIPAGLASADEAARLLGLEDRLRARVIGQDAASSALARAVRRRRAGVGDRARPASFLFAGRTGVGKTEMARTLARELFGDESAMIQIDMSEYMEAHAVARMVGAPPGYAGHDAGGQLTEAVRRRPYSVLLFDEVEKAHPEVSNLLLQVLDEGRLTDAQGREVRFEHTVVIMTSNAGAGASLRPLGFGSASRASSAEALERAVREALEKTFRPELLNRIDEIVCFNDLDAEALERILDLLLARPLAQAAQLGYEVVLTPAARAAVLSAGYDPTMGARPLRRAIQELVEDALAEAMLAGLAHGKVELDLAPSVPTHLVASSLGAERLPAPV